jgi:hypothetical protein
MSKFSLDDYAPVEERISLFYEGHPEGRIHTTVERLDPPLVVFRAEIYRDAEDTRPWATGYAYEKEGEGHVNRTSYIENCETSAIGRALANAGYHGKRDGSPRPSREEMEKVERMDSKPAAPEPDDMIDCPKCGGPLWDNRKDKKNPRGPDLKCRDKDGCDHAIWLGSWKDDLLKDLAGAHAAGAIDAKERDKGEQAAESKNPGRMLALGKWLDAKVQAGILGG